MNDFTKKIRLSFEFDKNEVNKIKQSMNSIGSIKFDNFTLNSKAINDMQSQIAELESLRAEINKTNDLISKLSELNSESAEKTIEQLQEYLELLTDAEASIVKSETSEELSEVSFDFDSLKDWFERTAATKLKQLGRSFLDEMKSIFNNAIKEADKMLSYSQLTDSSIRNQALTYGLSSSENYALDKTMDLLGLSNFEDLMYMNTQQQAKFYEKFNEYQQKYADLYDSGFFEEYQEFQWEMQEFKEDLMYEFMEWAMDNKDTIKQLLQAATTIAEFFVNTFGKVLDAFNFSTGIDESEIATKRAEIANINNSNQQTNINIDNTFNNVAQSDRTWLAHAGEMTYEQIIRALQ